MIEIRKANGTDVEQISDLIQESTRRNPNNYNPDQLKAWMDYNTPENILKYLNDRVTFCAFQGEELMGTISLLKNEITGFYTRFDSRGQGVGSALLKHLEEFALSEGLERLILCSTPSAEKFYISKGFTPTKTVVVNILGINFQEMEMSKLLS